MDTDSYITFLVFATLLVLIDAAVITISGRKYLRDDNHPGFGLAASWLTTTLFTLIVLGLAALISPLNPPVDGELQKLVTKLGVVLLLLAAAHAITMGVLGRYRGEERQEHLAEELTEKRPKAVPRAEVTPSLERDEPYSTV